MRTPVELAQGRIYGAIAVDLERREVVDVRIAQCDHGQLRGRLEVEVVSRRGGLRRVRSPTDLRISDRRSRILPSIPTGRLLVQAACPAVTKMARPSIAAAGRGATCHVHMPGELRSNPRPSQRRMIREIAQRTAHWRSTTHRSSLAK